MTKLIALWNAELQFGSFQSQTGVWHSLSMDCRQVASYPIMQFHIGKLRKYK
ncbi:MAG: hypothetical protein WCP55_15725 [Lentisphaerota bacterium]